MSKNCEEAFHLTTLEPATESHSQHRSKMPIHSRYITNPNTHTHSLGLVHHHQQSRARRDPTRRATHRHSHSHKPRPAQENPKPNQKNHKHPHQTSSAHHITVTPKPATSSSVFSYYINNLITNRVEIKNTTKQTFYHLQPTETNYTDRRRGRAQSS